MHIISEESAEVFSSQLPEFESKSGYGLDFWKNVMSGFHRSDNNAAKEKYISRSKQYLAENKPRVARSRARISTGSRIATIIKPSLAPPTLGSVRLWLAERTEAKRQKKRRNEVERDAKRFRHNLSSVDGADGDAGSLKVKKKGPSEMIKQQSCPGDTTTSHCQKQYDEHSGNSGLGKAAFGSRNYSDSSPIQNTSLFSGNESKVLNNSPTADADKASIGKASLLFPGKVVEISPSTASFSSENPIDVLQQQRNRPGSDDNESSTSVPPNLTVNQSDEVPDSCDLMGAEARVRSNADPMDNRGSNSPPTALHSKPALHGTSVDSPRSSNALEDSCIEGPPSSNVFKSSQNDLKNAKALHEQQHITVCSMELHVQTRLKLCPDPECDPIRAIFYTFCKDSLQSLQSGCVVDSCQNSAVNQKSLTRCGVTNLQTAYASDEKELISLFVALVRQADPDIVLGYEVQMSSWGYLLARAEQLGIDACREISRVPSDTASNRHSAASDAYGADNASEIHIVGRIVLNLWRLMRTELPLYDYTFENVAFHLLHERYPRYSFSTLTRWFMSLDWSAASSAARRHHAASLSGRLVDHYMCRVLGNLKLVEQQDFIGRTSELARVFGIQFYEVLTRGSQFRVSFSDLVTFCNCDQVNLVKYLSEAKFYLFKKYFPRDNFEVAKKRLKELLRFLCKVEYKKLSNSHPSVWGLKKLTASDKQKA